MINWDLLKEITSVKTNWKLNAKEVYGTDGQGTIVPFYIMDGCNDTYRIAIRGVHVYVDKKLLQQAMIEIEKENADGSKHGKHHGQTN